MILTLLQQNESFDSKLFQGNFKLMSSRVTFGNFNFFVRGSPIFNIKWIQIYRETGLQEVHFLNTPTRLIHFKGKFVV